jgi:hypothetical protein
MIFLQFTMHFQNFSHFLEKEKEKTKKDKHFALGPLKETLIKPSNGVPMALFISVMDSALRPCLFSNSCPWSSSSREQRRLGLAGGVAPRWRAAAVECQVACMAPA